MPLALSATRLLSTFLFRLTPHDAASLMATAGVLIAVALLAGALPARKAAALEPIGVLRDQ